MNLHFSRPLTFTPDISNASTLTLNGEFGTSFPAYVTLTLWSPFSLGVKLQTYPSGIFSVGISSVFPLGDVETTEQGASARPVSCVSIVTFLVSPRGMANKGRKFICEIMVQTFN
jgi:hypothetical protein